MLRRAWMPWALITCEMGEADAKADPRVNRDDSMLRYHERMIKSSLRRTPRASLNRTASAPDANEIQASTR